MATHEHPSAEDSGINTHLRALAAALQMSQDAAGALDYYSNRKLPLPTAVLATSMQTIHEQGQKQKDCAKAIVDILGEALGTKGKR